MKKTILSTAVLTILILSGCEKLPFGNKAENAVSPINTAMVERIIIQESVTVCSNIEPLKSRELGFFSDAKITEINAEEGDRVDEGTILARIDTSNDEYAIEAKEYELEQQRYSESPRKIALMEKELKALHTAMKNKIITAPFSGIVAEIKKQVGEVNLTSSGAGYLIKLIDDSSLKASVVVDELDIARIEVGQKGVFSFDAIPGETFEGRVSKVARIGRLNNNGLPVVDIELIIDEPDPRIFIPYSFKVEILTDEPAEFLVIPETAVIWEDDKVYANVKSGESTVKREIKIKEWKNGKTIILGGLVEGEEVVLTSQIMGKEDSLWM
ncbi:MAG: HlyD family efflux transporter periplasmic adaptor subunit [Spirochaetales bacterium]|nr:HlyD family efflux transporter periplasmic adaptor subunit [Spirochaetales bacterium]